MFLTQPKIFISSTILDLPSERKAALKAVEHSGGFPIMSEFTMEAQSNDSVTACLDKVKNSDIYVLILGGKYGWRPFDRESITELEYQTAIKHKLSILAYNTTYPKEPLQIEFEKKVESKYFRKKVNDAFELQEEITKSLQTLIQERQNEFFKNTESVYSNLVKITFPTEIYHAKLNINKKEIIKYNKARGYKFKKRPALYDFAVSALIAKNIRFPHDWIIWGKSILTFHNLQDDSIPLTEIIERGTAEKLTCEEIYDISLDDMSSFKFLLKKCLETKLYKLGVKYIKDSGLFVFIPIKKDKEDRWESRAIEWSKDKKATRTVVDVKRNLKDKEEVFNMKCLAFRVRFEFIDDVWYLAIKPDWLFLWPDFRESTFAFKNIQWLKRNERNLHVFNHFNFIMKFLQSNETEELFKEYKEYPFLKIGDIEKFDFAPIVPDDTWRNLESSIARKKLNDKTGYIDFFNT